MTKKLKWYDYLVIYVSIIYGSIYLFIPHRFHLQGWAIDWLLQKYGLIQTGFQHNIHIIIGVVLITTGIGYLMYRVKK